MDIKDILHSFMNAYWLRPETAMWRTLDVLSMENFEMKSPSLDIGCGDGTFSFLRMGGRLSDSFDAFIDVDHLNDFFNNEDVFDAYKERESTGFEVTKKACDCIDVGLDHKDNLMKKAKRLNLYKKFVVSDVNNGLPFGDETFLSVFSNIIYWLDDPSFVFSEIYRVLKPGGKACVMLPNTTFLKASFYYKYFVEAGKPGNFDFLSFIDRGRLSDNIKIVKTKDDWTNNIQSAGLKVIECVPHLSITLMQMWDIGLRPIFPFLKQMTDLVPYEKIADIKREWVDFFEKATIKIIEGDSDPLLMQGDEHCFFCFIVEKV